LGKFGLENRGFRNYADYMLTNAFQNGVEKLLQVAQCKRTAILCAEGLFWQCHRRLVSDFMVASGATVLHIMPSGESASRRSKSRWRRCIHGSAAARISTQRPP
jgi:uncharacterized protein (DUF488 family)